MNLATVLMCWNVPRIPEDLIYELFCNAGPVEEISFAQNGKSCFVIYEHADAVITAKDIFKDVKLNGRPLKMFDHVEITKIHSQQEQVAQGRNYEYENNLSQNFKSKSYDGQNRLHDSRTYSDFSRIAPDYRKKYSESSRRNLASVSVNLSQQSEMVNDQSKDWRENSMRNTSMTCHSSGNSAQNRPDLLPSISSPSSKTRKFNARSTDYDLNVSSDIFEQLMNPYSTPLSRNSQDMQDRYSARSSQKDYHEYDAGFPEKFGQGRWTGARTVGNNSDRQYSDRLNSEDDHRPTRRNTHDEFDERNSFSYSISEGDTRHNQRNKYDNYHSGHYRDQPYRKHHPHRETYAGGQKFTNSSSGANYKSQNHIHGGQQNHRSRKY